MTDREFDELLKDAFDRYAKVTLAKIPDKIPDLPKLSPKKVRRQTAKRRSTALILLTTACVGLLTLSVLLIAKIAGQESTAPLLPLSTAPQGSPDSPVSTLSPTGANTDSVQQPLITTTVPAQTAEAPESDSVTEQIYPDFFHSMFSGHSSSGDTGEFADPALISSELPALDNPLRTDEKRSFDKRTGGSYEFWNGEVQLFLQYETPVLPVAVTFTFGDPAYLPRTCILMGQGEDGSWVELQSYTCKITKEDVTVAFYLDFDGEDLADSTRYTDFYLSYQYVAMPDENYEVPDARLFGFTEEIPAFRFARYYVSDGSLYAVSTNAAELTLPADFGGSPLITVRRGAVSSKLAPVLCALTVPEGVQTVEADAFIGCDALQTISLPATFTLSLLTDSEDSQVADTLAEETLKNLDLNGDGIIGASLSILFKDCESLSEINVANGNPVLESRDGAVYLRDTNILLFPDNQ